MSNSSEPVDQKRLDELTRRFEDLVGIVRDGFRRNDAANNQMQLNLLSAQHDLKSVDSQVTDIKRQLDGDGQGPLIAQIKVLQDRVARHEKWVYIAITALVVGLWSVVQGLWFGLKP